MIYTHCATILERCGVLGECPRGLVFPKKEMLFLKKEMPFFDVS